MRIGFNSVLLMRILGGESLVLMIQNVSIFKRCLSEKRCRVMQLFLSLLHSMRFNAPS
jgi:hypothetical protein